jgi:hypothetical protein
MSADPAELARAIVAAAEARGADPGDAVFRVDDGVAVATFPSGMHMWLDQGRLCAAQSRAGVLHAGLIDIAGQVANVARVPLSDPGAN